MSMNMIFSELRRHALHATTVPPWGIPWVFLSLHNPEAQNHKVREICIISSPHPPSPPTPALALNHWWPLQIGFPSYPRFYCSCILWYHACPQSVMPKLLHILQNYSNLAFASASYEYTSPVPQVFIWLILSMPQHPRLTSIKNATRLLLSRHDRCIS